MLPSLSLPNTTPCSPRTLFHVGILSPPHWALRTASWCTPCLPLLHRTHHHCSAGQEDKVAAGGGQGSLATQGCCCSQSSGVRAQWLNLTFHRPHMAHGPPVGQLFFNHKGAGLMRWHFILFLDTDKHYSVFQLQLWSMALYKRLKCL